MRLAATIGARRVKVAYRIGFFVTLVAVVVGIVVVPFTVASMIASTHKPIGERAFDITVVSHSSVDHLAVNLEAISLDEVN